MNEYSRRERSKPISYLERKVVDNIIAGLDLDNSGTAGVITDGWDRTLRPEGIDTGNSEPLGHIAFMGDFEEYPET